MDEIQEIFFLECADLLSDLHSRLSVVESGESDIEDLNAIFRAVHSIKGGAGSFDLPQLVDFSHIFENVLDMLRSGDIAVDEEATNLMLQSADVLTDLVEGAQVGDPVDPSSYEPTIKALEAFHAANKGEADEEEDDFVFTPAGMGAAPAALDVLGLPPLGAPGLPPLPSIGGDAPSLPDLPTLPDLPASDVPSLPPLVPSAPAAITLKFGPKPSLYKSGLNSFRLLNDLISIGATDIVLHDADVPAMDSLDPEQIYIHWTMSFPPGVSRDEIEDMLFFAGDKCVMEFSEGTPSGETPIEASETALPPLPVLPEVAEIAEIPSLPAIDPVPAAPSGDSAETAPVVAPIEELKADQTGKADQSKKKSDDTAAKAKSDKNAGKSTGRKAPPPTIRVVLDKIDRLINQVGELVVTQAMLDETIADAGLERDPAVMSTITDFRQLTIDIQESVMAIRAQPIRSLFQRMGRVVRESAHAAGKSAKLVLEGEFTEVDNTIIESLADPLTHMLRNAVDHGLEKKEKRIELGKTPVGEVRLSAAHRGGKVVIEVSDDGAGVNREKVRSIAEEKGLIDPSAVLSDAEIDNILFMPGFSTADQVSTLSGRGVGMDVVKRSIQDIGGKVTIRSTPGQGSRITITLPLTLAILDGMLIRVGSETLVLPLTSVVETVMVPKSSIHYLGNATRMVDIRGSLLPLVDLGDHLGFVPDDQDDKHAVMVIVEADGDRWCALHVDAIIDQRQVVIKSLEENYGRVKAVSAATILGDGRLALIIDTEQLSEKMVARHTPSESADPELRKVSNG